MVLRRYFFFARLPVLKGTAETMTMTMGKGQQTQEVRVILGQSKLVCLKT